jgi:hypothetical protein
MFIFATLCVSFYCVCIAVLHTVVAGLLAGSQYPEGATTCHLGTEFSWFPCVWKRMLRWFPRLPVATACFSCSPPDLNFLDPYFIFFYMHYNHCHRTTTHLQLIIIIIIIIIIITNNVVYGLDIYCFYGLVYLKHNGESCLKIKKKEMDCTSLNSEMFSVRT